MIASIAVGPNTVTITPPAGWALVRRTDQATGTSNSLCGVQTARGRSRAGELDWTFSPSNTGAAGGIQAFSAQIPPSSGERAEHRLGHLERDTERDHSPHHTMIITSHGIAAPASGRRPRHEPNQSMRPEQRRSRNELCAASAAGASGAKSATATVAGTGNAHILALRRVLGSFNAFETSTAAADYRVLKTKVAGTSASAAVAALNAAKVASRPLTSETMRSILDASDNSAATRQRLPLHVAVIPDSPRI